MNDYRKVDSLQLYTFWKNLSIGLLIVIAMMSITKLLPYYFSPVVSLIGASVIYTMMYNDRIKDVTSCMLVPYSIFYCLINYSILTIILNILYIWGFIDVPKEIVFFDEPYIPALLMMPVSAVTMIVMYLRRKRIGMCVECHLRKGLPSEQGVTGNLITGESYFQIRNLALLFSVLSILVWAYFLYVYNDTTMTSRDWYVFTWMVVIAFVLDALYFVFRYFNLYLDLKENNEIIDFSEVEDMTSKTYVRYYVICGNNIYVDPHCIEAERDYREVIDTPFVTKRSVTGMTTSELKKTIENMTGVKDGELKFFFGRRMQSGRNQSMLRYFYFLDKESENLPELKVPGEWVDFEKIKYIYTHHPAKMGPVAVADITRMATIVLTEKLFDEEGFRKSKIKSYRPTFNLTDIRRSNLDFQDDKWIHISLFNSDTRLYRLKRWWRKITGRTVIDDKQWD